MNQLKVIEKDGVRVLTTAQLAESFGTESKIILKNFNRNKERYQEGKHFFAIQGEELKEFKTTRQIDDKSKHSPILYLWPEKGCWMHAKSLNTEKSWDAYENLVDDYYKIVEETKQIQPDLSALSPQLQFMILMEHKHKELEDKQSEFTQSLRHLSLVVDNEVWITEHQKADIKVAVKKRIGYLKGQAVDAHFQGAYGDMNTFFGVSKYDKIKRVDYEQAMEFISGWFPKKKEETASR